MIALGLLNIALKLARVIDSIALIWLYCLDMYDYYNIPVLLNNDFIRHSRLGNTCVLFNTSDG